MELVCLGVGTGKTMVYDGQPSSAFLLRVASEVPDTDKAIDESDRGKSLLLIDCGLGVTRACLQHVDKLPKLIYVSHNHTDHAGELPVILAIERTRPGGSRRTVIAERRIAEVLRERRLYETNVVGAFDADWIVCDEGQLTPLGHGLAIRVLGPCRHTELCFGFLLYQEVVATNAQQQEENADAAGVPRKKTRTAQHRAILGFTGDSGFSSELLRRLAEAPLILADARYVGTAEHASFEEISKWQQADSYSGRLAIYHYCNLDEAPCVAGLDVARPGEIVARWDARGNLVDGSAPAAL